MLFLLSLQNFVAENLQVEQLRSTKDFLYNVFF